MKGRFGRYGQEIASNASSTGASRSSRHAFWATRQISRGSNDLGDEAYARGLRRCIHQADESALNDDEHWWSVVVEQAGYGDLQVTRKSRLTPHRRSPQDWIVPSQDPRAFRLTDPAHPG
jgi:hypothetical protein